MYQLQSDVDISAVALTGMKQSGLCVMKDSGFEFLASDTYSTVDNKLRILFPDLFDWIIESEPDDLITSSWLVCMKPPYSRKSLVVYSDDQALPTGFDIMSACQLAKNKVGVQNRVLYLGKLSPLIYLALSKSCLVTREPVPSQILRKWRPIVPLRGLSTSKRDSGIEDLSSDVSEDDPSSPIPGPSTRPFIFPPPSQLHHNRDRSEEEVEEDIINISGKLTYQFILII